MLVKYNKTFIIKFETGKVTLIKGDIPQSLINDSKQLIRRWPQKGYVYGIKECNEEKIMFTKSIKLDFHQRFRNIFPHSEIHKTKPSRLKAI